MLPKNSHPIASLGETPDNMFLPDDSRRAYRIIGYFDQRISDDKEPSPHKIKELNAIKCRMASVAIGQIQAGIIPHSAGYWMQELKRRTPGPWSWQPLHEELEATHQALREHHEALYIAVAKVLGVSESLQGDNK